MTKKKSKKRSGSNSVVPPDAPTLFIDISAWSYRLRDALAELDAPFVALSERFPQNTPDTEWLKEAGKQGWIVLTRDKHIRRRPNELQAFRDSGVIVFVLTAGDASAADTAELVSRLYPKLIRKAQATKPPAMFSITLAGTISQIKL